MCLAKTSIYPGVTNFGKRFDIYNDATVIDVSREEGAEALAQFFSSVMEARYPTLPAKFTSSLRKNEVAAFLGKLFLETCVLLFSHATS